MSEMIERVARVLHADGYDTWPHPECTQCMELARAVIEVMRKPTGPMIDAGREIGPDAPYGATETAERWRAMIDAALSD